MDSKDEQYLILEQYRIYSEAKEKFIERQFSTNRFYLVFNLGLLLTTYLMNTFAPDNAPVIVLPIIGFAVSIMWWMNIDSYQMLIKVKYAKVLEYLETKLPEQPYHKEFVDYMEMKKKNNLIVFGDFQKYLTLVILLVYVVAFTNCVMNLIKIYWYAN